MCVAQDRQCPQRGFSLIELLVVIAIIAIISAIIFPVFASVREKGRQATVMSNFEKIQRGLGEFYQDQHHYPSALYGYVQTGQSLGAHPIGHAAPTGLFPQYINDPEVFVDPNNPDSADRAATISVNANVLCPSTDASDGCTSAQTGLVKSVAKSFYKADAFDANPMITGANTISSSSYMLRYQTSWSAMGAADVDVARQLRYPNPPGNTFVTCTSYHVPKGVVLVLWLSGSARTVNSDRYLQETGGTEANVWKIKP